MTPANSEGAEVDDQISDAKEADMCDPVDDEDDEDLYAVARPQGPSPNELRRQAAERGDVDYFLDLVRTKHWSLFSIGEILRYLMRAAEVRARSDPEAYAGELFGKMVGFNSFLLMRTQIYIADRVVGRGPQPTAATLADLSSDVTERLLPRLAEMQKAMAELLVAQAQTARMWALTRAKEAQAGRASPAERREARPRSAGGQAGRPGPGAAKAKADGARDGVVPLPARGRRRG